jgi:hypothetical protein
MTRIVKTLGVALCALLALTAIAAAAASAANYTASVYPTTAKGISPLGNGVFTTEAGKTECITHEETTIVSSSGDITVVTIATSCKSFGFINATISNCTYTMTEPTGAADNWSAKIDIVGSPCTITSGTCKVTIPTQGPLSSVAITNDTAAGDVTVKANVTGIKYTVTQDGFGCPFAGTGEKTGATFVHGSPVTIDSTNGATIDVG